jgi:hypothetical protein
MPTLVPTCEVRSLIFKIKVSLGPWTFEKIKELSWHLKNSKSKNHRFKIFEKKKSKNHQFQSFQKLIEPLGFMGKKTQNFLGNYYFEFLGKLWCMRKSPSYMARVWCIF